MPRSSLYDRQIVGRGKVISREHVNGAYRRLVIIISISYGFPYFPTEIVRSH